MTQPSSSSLINISQLEILVDIDKSQHGVKDIAQLFLNAARDWDTFNQNDISDFVKELKQYFGFPLTKQKITNKTFENAWRQEAGSSLLQMLDLSEKLYNQSDLDKSISEILLYYEQQLQKIDFIANLYYLPTAEGGRQNPTITGYRAQIKFDFDDMQTSGQQIFLNKEIVHPGDTVEVAIKIVSVEHFKDKLTEGISFEFREGTRVIGTGKIIDILNLKLNKACR